MTNPPVTGIRGLLARWLAPAVAKSIPPSGIGGQGPGVISLAYGIPLSSLSRHPQKLAREAQQISVQNPWIRAAERTITGRTVGLPWHLEDEDGKEIEVGAGDPVTEQLRQLLRRPNPDRNGANTWRKLARITARHAGVCGTAFWYLDGLDYSSNPLPAAIYYINPARMMPAATKAGRLAGWVLDPTDWEGTNGTPLTLDEVLQFDLEPPDWGHMGTGLVESAYTKIQLAKLADTHAAQTFAGGGRLAGFVAPSEGSGVMPDNVYQDLLRDFRNAAESPDAAKRLVVAKGPLDWKQTTATPQQLQMVEVAEMGQQHTLALWGVPVSQLGIPIPGGLNSDVAKHDEAVLMQGAVHDRVEALRETIQVHLLDLAPQKPTLVIEEPSFDDKTPAYTMAAQARVLPLTNDERRDIVDLPAYDEEEYGDFGKAVYMPKDMVRVDPNKPEEPILALPTGMPQIGPGGIQRPVPVNGGEQAQARPAAVPAQRAKATVTVISTAPDGSMVVTETEQDATPDKAGSIQKLRDQVTGTVRHDLRTDLAAYLQRLRQQLADSVRQHGEHVVKKPADSDAWWKRQTRDRELARVLAPHYAALAGQVVGGMRTVIDQPAKAKADSLADRVRGFITTRGGERITQINETTRQGVQQIIQQGVADGLGPAQIGDLIEDADLFGEYRSELIARTEAMLAYNDASLHTYREGYGIERVEAHDGDGDAECAARNGQVLPIDEALGVTDHPNGTLDWVPVIGGTA
jgi:phage portal protein BeeE